MALFEVDGGRLVPAQFGRESAEGFTPAVLHMVRAQVLEIVARPLFPITWRSLQPGAESDGLPRLTALDASGQVVAVEVVDYLDSDLLIESLSRLADTAAMSWVELAAEYPGGIEGFKIGWAQFRESMPPTTPNGPRLIIVAAEIDPEVRPALDVLSSSGVEVHEMSLREMANGRAFLAVSEVGPRTYGHRANLLVGESGSGATLKEIRTDGVPRPIGEVPPARKVIPERPAPKAVPEAAPQAEPSTPPAPAKDLPAAPPAAGRPAPPRRPRRPRSPSRVARVEHGLGRRAASAFPSRRALASPFPSRSQVHTESGSIRIPLAPLDAGPQALRVLAEEIGSTTPLALPLEVGWQPEAYLQMTGRISLPNGEFDDPAAALQAIGLAAENSWDVWRLGDAHGPTLGEALAEVNREVPR